MKLIKTTLASLAFLALVAADKKFDPKHEEEGSGSGSSAGGSKPKIKSVANFGNQGAKMELCPSGDCENGQVIRVKMERLEEFEYDKKGEAKQVQKADNFQSADFEWSELEAEDINDAPVLSTTYVSQLEVGNKGDMVDFNVTASIFEEDGWADNGNQSVPVRAGSLKFTIAMANWPFESDANFVRFGVELFAKSKDGKERETAEKKPRKGAKGIDRVGLGEGMYVDVPTIAVIDGVDREINSTVEIKGKKMTLLWDFPYFTDRVDYDPVLGSDDISARPNDGSSGSAGSSSGSSTGSTGTGSGSGPTTTPAPVTPAPVTPAPVTPAPVTPAPVTPAPVTPAPETPAPTTATTPAPASRASALQVTSMAVAGLAALACYFA